MEGSAAHAASRPNIVLILVDDQPVLDGRLLDYEPAVRDLIAARGATFSDFHSESPLCCPARAGYLTGQHTHNHGVSTTTPSLFDPTMTIATQLQRAGYFTMLAGKYLNGYKASASSKHPWLAPNVPPGWNRWSAMGKPAYYDYTLYRTAAPRRCTARAGRLLDRRHRLEGRGDDPLRAGGPAAVRLDRAVLGPHPVHARPALRRRRLHAEDRFWMPPSWNEADVSDKPGGCRTPRSCRGRRGFDVDKLCRAMLGVNDLVQQVVSALAATGRLQNTILIYAGDNGMLSGEHRMTGKTAPYETQVPFYVRWDGVVRRAARYRRAAAEHRPRPTLCAVVGCRARPVPERAGEPRRHRASCHC